MCADWDVSFNLIVLCMLHRMSNTNLFFCGYHEITRWEYKKRRKKIYVYIYIWALRSICVDVCCLLYIVYIIFVFLLSDIWRKCVWIHCCPCSNICGPLYIWRSQWFTFHLRKVCFFKINNIFLCTEIILKSLYLMKKKTSLDMSFRIKRKEICT